MILNILLDFNPKRTTISSISTLYTKHGQTAARQRFFAALVAKFNDVYGHIFVVNLLKIEIFLA
jgi:hypothetical protein